MTQDAPGRWARDLYRRYERGEVDGRVAELFAAITPEARADLLMAVEVGLEELRDAYRGEREYMPPCQFRYLRWLATFLNSPLEDEVCEHLIFTTDSAWGCDCRECVAFVIRVEAGTRRFVAAMKEAELSRRGRRRVRPARRSVGVRTPR